MTVGKLESLQARLEPRQVKHACRVQKVIAGVSLLLELSVR